MNENFTTSSLLTGHTSEDTAYLVEDYPYGFRLRTQIRYWVETTKSGDRMVSQTLNPKTGRWNKPKKSTYAPVLFLFIDEKGHVSRASLSSYDQDEWLNYFQSVTEGKLSDAQKRQLAVLLAAKKIMSKVKFEVREGRQTEEEKAEQDQIHGQISQAIGVEAHRVLREL